MLRTCASETDDHSQDIECTTTVQPLLPVRAVTSRRRTETEVEHPVSLVEHEERDTSQICRFLLHEIDESTLIKDTTCRKGKVINTGFVL